MYRATKVNTMLFDLLKIVTKSSSNHALLFYVCLYICVEGVLLFQPAINSYQTPFKLYSATAYMYELVSKSIIKWLLIYNLNILKLCNSIEVTVENMMIMS